jgi:predicted alpha/beta hydrolase family esterase
VQFASTDDPFINISEPRFIHDQLDTEYFELQNRGHFMIEHNPANNAFPEIIDIIAQKTN